jgi:hypothetical protein
VQWWARFPHMPSKLIHMSMCHSQTLANTECWAQAESHHLVYYYNHYFPRAQFF